MTDTKIDDIDSQPDKKSPFGKILLIIVIIIIIISLISKNKNPEVPVKNGTTETKSNNSIPPDSLHNSN